MLREADKSHETSINTRRYTTFDRAIANTAKTIYPHQLFNDEMMPLIPLFPSLNGLSETAPRENHDLQLDIQLLSGLVAWRPGRSRVSSILMTTSCFY